MYTQEALQKVCWRIIAANYRTLHAMCSKAADYDADLADELMSDVVYVKMPSIVEKWSTGARPAPLEHYMRSMLYWYLRKHRARERKRTRKLAEMAILEGSKFAKIETTTNLEVQSLLEGLSQKDHRMVSLVYLNGYTMQECADIMDISIGHVSGRLKKICKLLKDRFPEWLPDQSNK